MIDELGDRMKWYEDQYTESFTKFTPVIARLDGRAFHTFTKNLKKPYDPRLAESMIETTHYLVKTSGAVAGYTQSDEISLVWKISNPKFDYFFNGRLQKMNSVLASMTSVYFNRNIEKLLPSKKDAMPLFDCRVFQLPEHEVSNYFVWREKDALRNSVTMLAHSVFSHKQCYGKNQVELLDMLKKNGIDWNCFPKHFRCGLFMRKIETEQEPHIQELSSLPEKHHLRVNPDLKIKRSIIFKEEQMPYLANVKNRLGFILNSETPVLK